MIKLVEDLDQLEEYSEYLDWEITDYYSPGLHLPDSYVNSIYYYLYHRSVQNSSSIS